MYKRVDQLLEFSAAQYPENNALIIKDVKISYLDLNNKVNWLSALFQKISNEIGQRVGVFLEKREETVVSIFASSRCGKVFVPINPILKASQVQYIVGDCDIEILVTSKSRLNALKAEIEGFKSLKAIVLVDEVPSNIGSDIPLYNYPDPNTPDPNTGDVYANDSVIDEDVAAILYTSGSTGKPKGVVLSHRNIISGAKSVAEYLESDSSDNILSVLPLSFDYGLNQIMTTILVGGTVILLNYLFPLDVIKAVDKYKITGLAAVPPLWVQVAELEWGKSAKQTLRYITNSGGVMPLPTLDLLREKLPQTKPILMYGLTEAFRSTYLPYEELDKRPTSMGKVIPNERVLVLRSDGIECDVDEPGELVHFGALVAKGYWNDKERTNERFKPLPASFRSNAGEQVPVQEIAVWSGDLVKKDSEGYLYFVGRNDEMIKTSGYRVSPAEVEEVIYKIAGISEAVAIGVPHPRLGQAIVVIAKPDTDVVTEKQILKICKKELPAYMVPALIKVVADIPRNANGKIDRSGLAKDYSNQFCA